ncbi:hypothetical protein IFM89_029057 [Coptis chinensis]|uniref:Ribulose bisphosphate carboxylase/oxygenase activase, chloroplastic n=1 Tax=Coptis chinensis TaxID=261450 RepID=A0A835IEQ8_9MAGN|nr:hypothetical protein IFM89_029057 [Coptis chinensis]
MILHNTHNLILSPNNTHSFISPKIIHTSFPSLCSKNTNKTPTCACASASDEKRTKKISEQSSWEAKDAEGNDYLYRLGKEADNMNISVGAKPGVIDHLFVGNFLGRDADIVFDYRQKVTRSFEYLQGDYYIAPAFMVSFLYFLVRNVVSDQLCHIVKNYITHLLNVKVPLILGIWGGKGQGKSFQTELIFQAMGVEPVIMSAGELESDRAGEPGKLIRERYRTASQVVQNQGKMSCLMINDIDAGLGRFGNTQMTVNNQIVVGTLMNLSDNPTRVSVGQDWRDSDISHRIPIIVTGNDLSTIYAPLIRDGRMDKFYWLNSNGQNRGIPMPEAPRGVHIPQQGCENPRGNQVRGRGRGYQRPIQRWVDGDRNFWEQPIPHNARQENRGWSPSPPSSPSTDRSGRRPDRDPNRQAGDFERQPTHEDITNIVCKMYEKDGISREAVVNVVDSFPNQALDFYGALRSRTYDRSVSKWVDDIGGIKNLGTTLLKRRKDDQLTTFVPPKQTVEALLESGYSLLKEQQLIMENKLSKEYMKNMDD